MSRSHLIRLPGQALNDQPRVLPASFLADTFTESRPHLTIERQRKDVPKTHQLIRLLYPRYCAACDIERFDGG